jgi:hypothetical protein
MTSSFAAKRLVAGGGVLAFTLVACSVEQVGRTAEGTGAPPCEHSTPADGSCDGTGTDAGVAPEAAAAMPDSAACPGLDAVCGSDADVYSCMLAWSTASNVSSWCQRAFSERSRCGAKSGRLAGLHRLRSYRRNGRRVRSVHALLLR